MASKPDLKITGAEYKAWIASDWGHPDAHWDDYQAVVDGVEVDDIDDDTVSDTAVIEIYGGVVLLGNGKDMSAKSHFNRWKKAQTSATVAIEIPKDKLDELKARVAALGGKLLSR